MCIVDNVNDVWKVFLRLIKLFYFIFINKCVTIERCEARFRVWYGSEVKMRFDQMYSLVMLQGRGSNSRTLDLWTLFLPAFKDPAVNTWTLFLVRWYIKA